MRPAVRIPRVAAATLVTWALLASPSGAQVAYDGPSGRVEVLGLRAWTLEMLRDSIRRRFPGQTLESAACMVTLRDSLHFADALVQGITYSAGAGAAVRNYLVVKVIEPPGCEPGAVGAGTAEQSHGAPASIRRGGPADNRLARSTVVGAVILAPPVLRPRRGGARPGARGRWSHRS